MKATELHPLKLVHMLALAVALLSGCAVTGSIPQSCKVFDPDLAHGAYRGGCTDGLADGYGEVSGAGSYRGDFFAGKKHGKGIKVMPTFHPAYLLRNPGDKRLVWADIKAVMAELALPVPPR